MGNRAVITTQENFDNNGVGIYLHWNGGRNSVEAFLKYCKLKGYRCPENDCYGWAYLCGVLTNFFGDGLSVGIDTIDKLDCDNGDNGMYIIKDWEIVGRKYSYIGSEANVDYNKQTEMLMAINENMPEHMQMNGKKFAHPFINDEEKMVDFFMLSKEEFLMSYSYLTEEEYEATCDAIMGKIKDGE